MDTGLPATEHTSAYRRVPSGRVYDMEGIYKGPQTYISNHDQQG